MSEVIKRKEGPVPRPQDWGEDFADEDNGCYGHICTLCGREYLAHKRRYATCKECSDNAKRGNAIIDTLRNRPNGQAVVLEPADADSLLLRIGILEAAEKKAVELMLTDFGAMMDRDRKPREARESNG